MSAVSFTGIRNPSDIYRTQQIMSATPEKLVVMVYDYVLAACKAQDGKKAARGLAELIDALDFDQGEIALGLFRLYRYAMERVKEGKFDEVITILQELKATWVKATSGKSA